MHFLENILRELRDAGFVDTMRGSEGGYQLAVPADRIAPLSGPATASDTIAIAAAKMPGLTSAGP